MKKMLLMLVLALVMLAGCKTFRGSLVKYDTRDKEMLSGHAEIIRARKCGPTIGEARTTEGMASPDLLQAILGFFGLKGYITIGEVEVENDG